ncbi:MAG: hypothetical protein HYU57_01105 [Micavibrio aeruginosavorus]|nr:hypothetical protein [Micavibrio aeruginosavorus]
MSKTCSRKIPSHAITEFIKGYDAIKNTINDGWAATGAAAENILDTGIGHLGNLFDGFLNPVGDMPQLCPADFALPGWIVPDVVTPFEQAETTSPIVLDVDMSGTIELAAKSGSGSVYWDIDSDGYAEDSGWITGGDGLLCVDANSDGVIAQSELFGNDANYANGYLKLSALYDTNGSNTITSADTGFTNLLVWIDANADGRSQAAELYTLSSLGITSIGTAYSAVNYQIAGNQISQQSTFTMNGNTYRRRHH